MTDDLRITIYDDGYVSVLNRAEPWLEVYKISEDGNCEGLRDEVEDWYVQPRI